MDALRLVVAALAGSLATANGSTPSASAFLERHCPPGTHAVCPTPTTCTCVADEVVLLTGNVVGLSGKGLTLINEGYSIGVSANAVTIPAKAYEEYGVDINTDPTGPLQACYVVNGYGTATASGNSQPFTVICGTPYTVGGTITGLVSGSSAPYLTLSLESPSIAGQPQTENQNGPFTFATPLANGLPYQVMLNSDPNREVCSIANGSGTIAGSNVTDILVSCSPCGGNHEPECVSGSASACDPGYAPNAKGICTACRGDEEPACATGSACGAGYTVNPARSVCVPCGQPGLLACGGTTCNTGVLVGKRFMAANATKLPELVVMCAASDYAGVVVDPQNGGTHPFASSPLTTLIPQFFTPSGSGTDNLFDYFTEMTYGRIDRSGTVVIPWTSVNYTQQQLGALGRNGRVQACVKAAKAADPTLDTSKFVDFVAAFNVQMDGGNQGDSVSTDPYGIFTNFMAQEVTHSLGQGLHTDRLGCIDSQGNPVPYCDPWDEMSAAQNYSSANSTWWAPANFGGPQHSTANMLVAANRILVGSRMNVGVIAPSEIYKVSTGTSETVTLTAVNRDERSGIRVIEIPAGGAVYTVELVWNTGWDNQDPETGVLVHSVQVNGQVTLIPKFVGYGDGSYASGDTFTVGNATVTIGTIDTKTSTVPITISD